MQSLSENPVDAAALNDARNELAQIGYTMDTFEQSITDARNKHESLNETIRQGSVATDNLANKAKSMVGAFMGMATVKKAFDFIQDSFDSFNIKNNVQRQLQVVLRNVGATEDAYDDDLRLKSNDKIFIIDYEVIDIDKPYKINWKQKLSSRKFWLAIIGHHGVVDSVQRERYHYRTGSGRHHCRRRA